MGKYMFQARYTSEGAKGVMAAAARRARDAIAKAVASVGGKLDAFYFAFGGVDAFVIAELPDDVSAAAMSMAVGASGTSSTTTVKLLTPEDMDKAAKVAVTYRPPGK
jgi:uncharacterized protein with GYD domain